MTSLVNFVNHGAKRIVSLDLSGLFLGLQPFLSQIKFIDALGGCSKLRTLNLSRNLFSKCLEPLLRGLAGCVSLEKLDLSRNHLDQFHQNCVQDFLRKSASIK